LGTGKRFYQVKCCIEKSRLVARVHPHKLALEELRMKLKFRLGGGGVGKIAPV